jgi:pimeloyl-ACP methyl ester carboxylesterase
VATFVLVHGAGEGGWIWKPTADRLRAAGHTPYTPTLDGCAERAAALRPGITIETQAREIADLLYYDDLGEVVLCGTSTGGMVVCRIAEVARDRISQLVFVDALALLDGETVQSVSSRPARPAGEQRIAIAPGPTFFREIDFDDPELRAWALARSSSFPGATSDCPVRLATFWGLPWRALVVRTTKGDPAEALQRRTAELLGAEYLEIDSGHYPMLTHPELLASILISVLDSADSARRLGLDAGRDL